MVASGNNLVMCFMVETTTSFHLLKPCVLLIISMTYLAVNRMLDESLVARSDVAVTLKAITKTLRSIWPDISQRPLESLSSNPCH